MYIVFDIGGTHMRVARSLDGRALDGTPIIVSTPAKFDDGVLEFSQITRELLRGEKCVCAAGGVAGPFNKSRTELSRAPHLPDWVGKPIAAEFQKALEGISVVFENDAALAGLAEARRGAGKGYEIVAYVTIGTGVGGVRVVDGAIDKNAFGFEPGHQIIDASGTHLEDIVGGLGIEKTTSKKPSEIHDQKIWNDIAVIFARGLTNTILHWSPDIVVIGGGLASRIPLDILQSEINSNIRIFSSLPPIVLTRFGDNAGLEGALDLLGTRV